MTVLYATTLVLGAAAVGIALAMIRVQSALDVWWQLASVFSGGMLGLFLLGYFSRRTGNVEAVVAVVVGVLVILAVTAPRWMPFTFPVHNLLTIVLGTSAIFLTGFVLTRVMNWPAGAWVGRGVEER
jgi:SSS family solute:Na+ symporter